MFASMIACVHGLSTQCAHAQPSIGSCVRHAVSQHCPVLAQELQRCHMLHQIPLQLSILVLLR